MKTIPISDAESLVMEVLWRSKHMYADEVVAALVSQHDWQESTVKTLLNRLLKKGAITAEKDGRRYLYAAMLKREQWVATETKSMIDRLFGGRIAPLVAHFGKHRKLSKADLDELKRLVEALDNER